MYFVSPQDLERFALRFSLLYGRGFTSFEPVRTVDRQLYLSFVEAARAAAKGCHLEDAPTVAKLLRKSYPVCGNAGAVS